MGFLFILFLCACYLLGSIPFGLVLTRLAGLGDLRKVGPGTIGATNVLRTGRKDLAALTVLLDAGKAAFCAFIATHLFPDEPFASFCAGFLAIIGHNFPIWLKFKGGKGVASTLGLMLYLTPLTGLCVCLTWLLMAVLFRYSSLSALMAMVLAPLYAILFGDDIVFIFGYFLLMLLSFVRHKSNIHRLLHGKESKIRLKKGTHTNADDGKGTSKLDQAKPNRRRRSR